MKALHSTGRILGILPVLAILPALTLGSPPPAAAAQAEVDPDDPGWVSRSLEELAAEIVEARRQAGLPPLERLPALDRAAAGRAEHVAGLPHARRLQVSEPIADEVNAQGIRLYRSVSLHLDMQRGYRHPAQAFVANWRRHPGWKKVVDPGNDAVGFGMARGEDGWIVFTALLLDEWITPTNLAELERLTLEAINRRREEHGLPELVDSICSRRGRPGPQRRHGRAAVLRPRGGRTAGPSANRVDDTGTIFAVLAENIYRGRGFEDPVEAAVSGWMKSKGHRKNILDPRLDESGIGIATDEEGNVYFTHVLGTRSGAR